MADSITDILGPPPSKGKPTAESILGPKPGGRRVPRGTSRTAPSDYPALPFIDRVAVSQMDNPAEKEAWLEQKYGKGSTGQDKKGMYVEVGGKRMRVSTGFLAELTGSAPQL